jgi:hypothetical protein
MVHKSMARIESSEGVFSNLISCVDLETCGRWQKQRGGGPRAVERHGSSLELCFQALRDTAAWGS